MEVLQDYAAQFSDDAQSRFQVREKFSLGKKYLKYLSSIFFDNYRHQQSRQRRRKAVFDEHKNESRLQAH